MTTRDDWIGFSAIAAIVIGTVALTQLAPGMKPATVSVSSTASGPDASCAEWTDGCVVCQRVDGEPMCSTSGIACVPSEMQCLRR